MFFSLRKKKKLAEEAKKLEQQRIEQEAIQKAKQEAATYKANLETFARICDMVRSRPKERQLVVVQRRCIFKEKSERSWHYRQLAWEMFRRHRAKGQKWMSYCDNSLYAFYAPTKLDDDFREALKEFSKDGYLIQRIRYYSYPY